MKVTGKPVWTSVGLFFIGFALLSAILILPGAKGAQSPFLCICIFGGLFVGIPAALGEDATNCHACQKDGRKEREYPRECAAKGTKSVGYQHGPIPGLPECGSC